MHVHTRASASTSAGVYLPNTVVQKTWNPPSLRNLRGLYIARRTLNPRGGGYLNPVNSDGILKNHYPEVEKKKHVKDD